MCLIQFLTSMLKSCYTTERERRRVPENVFSAVIVKVPSCALLTLIADDKHVGSVTDQLCYSS